MHHAGSFRDLKEILAADEDIGNSTDVSYEIKERAHLLCSKFLGGAWKSVAVDDLCLTRMKGGMSNMLFLCQYPIDQIENLTNGEPDKTLLRVYFNPETESHLVAESVIFTLLSERQLGPLLYGIFNGGRLEEYIVSRPLTCPEIRQEEISLSIARKIARVHKLNVPISKEPTYLCEALDRWIKHLLEIAGCIRPFKVLLPGGKDCIITKQMLLWEIEMIRWMERLKLCSPSLSVPINTAIDKTSNGTNYKVRIVDLDELTAHLYTIKRAISRSKSPAVFCHNDLQEGNILLPKESSDKDLVVIDFEYASYNYRAFDFANHFCEWTISYGHDEPPHYMINLEYYPTVEEQIRFIREYLKESTSSGPKNQPPSTNLLGSDMSGDQITDENLERIREETESFVPVSHFFWGVWALLQVELSPVRFGFAEYARDRLSLYFQLRPNLTRLINKKDSKSTEPVSPTITRRLTLSPADDQYYDPTTGERNSLEINNIDNSTGISVKIESAEQA